MKSYKSKSKSGIDDGEEQILICSNFLFGFLVIYFLIIVSAPLFGGVTLPLNRYIPFAFWTGFYFINRYFLKCMRDQIKLKDYQYWFIGLYYNLILLEFPAPVNFIAFILFFVLFIKTVKNKTDAWATNPDSNAQPNA